MVVFNTGDNSYWQVWDSVTIKIDANISMITVNVFDSKQVKQQ